MLRPSRIRVNAYIRLNTFNGGYIHQHPEEQPFTGAQWILSQGWILPPDMDYMLDLGNEAARQYLRDSVRRIMQMGFDGIYIRDDRTAEFGLH